MIWNKGLWTFYFFERNINNYKSWNNNFCVTLVQELSSPLAIMETKVFEPSIFLKEIIFLLLLSAAPMKKCARISL